MDQLDFFVLRKEERGCRICGKAIKRGRKFYCSSQCYGKGKTQQREERLGPIRVDFLECRRCNRIQPLSEFQEHKECKYGVVRTCKSCKKLYDLRHKEQIDTNRRAWGKRNRQKVNQRAREYLAANNNRIKELAKIRRERDKEKIAEQKRASRLRHIEHIRTVQRKYYLANIDKLKAYTKLHRERHKAKYKLLDRIKHGRRKAAKGECTLEQLESRLAYYGWKCWLCSEPYQEIDHVKPIAKGGSNWPSNLRPICRQCNSFKRAKWPYP